MDENLPANPSPSVSANPSPSISANPSPSDPEPMPVGAEPTTDIPAEDIPQQTESVIDGPPLGEMSKPLPPRSAECHTTVASLLATVDSFRSAVMELQHALHGDSETLSVRYLIQKVHDVGKQVELLLTGYAEHDNRIAVLESRIDKASITMRPIVSEWRKKNHAPEKES